MPRDGLRSTASLSGQGHPRSSAGPQEEMHSDRQCRVLGEAWLSTRLFSTGLLKSESINGSVSLLWSPPAVFTSPEFK